MALDFLDGVLFSYLGIREGPENGVQSHEQRLYEYPSEINRSGDHLFFMHGDIEDSRFVAYLRRLDGWLRNLWRWTVERITIVFRRPVNLQMTISADNLVQIKIANIPFYIKPTPIVVLRARRHPVVDFCHHLGKPWILIIHWRFPSIQVQCSSGL